MLNYYQPDPRWRHQGPPIPLWFRAKLRWVDPHLEILYHPPWSRSEPRGLDPGYYPYGVWDICRRLPLTRRYRIIATFVISKAGDSYLRPSMATFRVIQQAYRAHRLNQTERLDAMVDKAIVALHRTMARNSREGLKMAMRDRLSKLGHRQWTNRVFIREVPKSGSVS